MRTRVSTDPADIDAVMAIVASYGAPTATLAQIRTFVAAELADLGSGRLLFILEDGGAPVAAVQLVLPKNAPPHAHSLQVKQSRKRQGLGTELMLAVEAHARSLRVPQITLSVDADNAPALALYSRLGYTLVTESAGRSGKLVRLLSKQL